jgi:hypothetical protein
MGSLCIGPLYLCKESTDFFWCMQEAALGIKFLALQKTALRYKVGWFLLSFQMKPQRFISNNKNILILYTR